ncbi:MAG: small multi-drug export protein [Bacilli bacterium]|nr:small multi-drug export protein [Bacilli bacterium]
MTEKITQFIISVFGAWAGTLIGKYLIVFVISMVPILELRGGLLAASVLGLPIWQSYIICAIGNMIPIPFILWLINPLFRHLKNWKGIGKFVSWCERKAHSKKEQIEKLKYWGLFLFVGIPLPGTGAWTGCLIAALLDLDKKKSLFAAILGVLMAGIIMLILSYGVLGSVLG